MFRISNKCNGCTQRFSHYRCKLCNTIFKGQFISSPRYHLESAHGIKEGTEKCFNPANHFFFSHEGGCWTRSFRFFFKAFSADMVGLKAKASMSEKRLQSCKLYYHHLCWTLWIRFVPALLMIQSTLLYSPPQDNCLRPGPETGGDNREFFSGPTAPGGPMGAHRGFHEEIFFLNFNKEKTFWAFSGP